MSYNDKLYYMQNLRKSLIEADDQSNESRLYREHFYQTVQSLVFLKNIEKIDEFSLIEKIVYLPPNQQSTFPNLHLQIDKKRRAKNSSDTHFSLHLFVFCVSFLFFLLITDE